MFENDNGEPGQEPYVSSEKESEVQIADMTTLDAEEDDSVKDELQCSTHQTSASDCSCRLPSSSNVGSIRSHSTLGDPNFVENYFKSSRLHFIGTWRNQYRKRFPSSSKGFKSTEPNLNALTNFQKAAIIHIDMDSLQKNFGMKTGEMLWNHGRGIDNRLLGVIQDCKSIGAEVNWGVRFKDWKDSQHFLSSLCKEVSLRLQGCGVLGRTFTLKIKKRSKDAGEPMKYTGCGEC